MLPLSLSSVPTAVMASALRQYALRFTPEKQESLLKLVILSCSAVLGELTRALPTMAAAASC